MTLHRGLKRPQRRDKSDSGMLQIDPGMRPKKGNVDRAVGEERVGGPVIHRPMVLCATQADGRREKQPFIFYRYGVQYKW